jgi:ferredoxin
MAMLMIAAQAEVSPEQKIVNTGKYVSLTGILSVQDDVYSLQTDSIKVELLTAPEEYLEDHGADLQDQDTLTVTGYNTCCQMLVSSIQEGKRTAIIRSQLGTPYIISNDQKTYAANPAICIGCGLCPKNCPANAITMIKSKAVTDETKCISCGICEKGNGKTFKGCPVKAQHQLK